LLIVLLLPLVLVAGGFVYETIMEAGDAKRYPPPGQLVDVGGYAMDIYCVGEGSPTIIGNSFWPPYVTGFHRHARENRWLSNRK
jgi:hypothetical protein